MNKIVLFLFLIFNINLNLFAESTVTIVPYISSANYDINSVADANATDTNTTTDTNSSINSRGAIKSDILIGLYSIIDDNYQTIEFSLELKKLTYQNNDKLTQINLASSYKKYLTKNFKLNTLLHYISNNIESDGTTIALVGVNYIKSSRLKLNLQAAYSIYNSESLANKILQIKPTASFTYGHKNSNWGILYPEISLYYIKPYSENVTLDSSYYSTELSLTHVKESFRTKLSYWVGKQLYAVRDNGFTIYNLNEIHNSGTSLSFQYKIDNSLGIKASYTSEYYTRIGSTDEEYMDRILFLANFSF